jgi:hypothetical protein
MSSSATSIARIRHDGCSGRISQVAPTGPLACSWPSLMPSPCQGSLQRMPDEFYLGRRTAPFRG